MMPEANLVGGSERDREQILQLHADYIDANARFDWGKLAPIWSPAPEAAVFQLNSQTYHGREHWARRWEFQRHTEPPGEAHPPGLCRVGSADMRVGRGQG